MSGSMSRRGPMGAALFRSPTFSSNSEANTEDGSVGLLPCAGSSATSSAVGAASFRCCR
uniref:Uncharacterized protein n=1 Tax=Gasterosteus aculeatus aculeatus TaxID=481459 RepID=A0AAQ4PBZ0_GASAC